LNSNRKKILFLIFSPLFTKGGHSKNFMNLIKNIEPEIIKNDFKASIISYNNNSDEKSENNIKMKDFPFLNIYKVKLLKRIFPSGKVLFQLGEYIMNFLRTLFYVVLHRPDIVYAYSNKPLYIVAPLKKMFGFKLIYDMRGDTLNEIKVQGASEKYIRRLTKQHNGALAKTDLIFSVSSSYKVNSKARLEPKYNYYDGDIFFYDESMMIKKKEELGLKDKFVFVYTGNAHYYQFLDGNIHFFSQFLKKHEDSFLIIITEYDFSIFEKILEKYLVPEDKRLFISLPQNKIAEIQQMADMGFLIREDLPLNNHAYPTKFAEYLASGVPVLMTPYILSIAEEVRNNDLGEVIDLKENYTGEIDKIYSIYKNNLIIKKKCSEFAKRELMWQKKAIDIFNIIRNL
jgi:hypothetical protein